MVDIQENINHLHNHIQKAKDTPDHIHLTQALEHLEAIEQNIEHNSELKAQLRKAKQAITQSQSALEKRNHAPKSYEESIEETIRVCNRVDYPLCY